MNRKTKQNIPLELINELWQKIEKKFPKVIKKNGRKETIDDYCKRVAEQLGKGYTNIRTSYYAKNSAKHKKIGFFFSSPQYFMDICDQLPKTKILKKNISKSLPTQPKPRGYYGSYKLFRSNLLTQNQGNRLQTPISINLNTDSTILVSDSRVYQSTFPIENYHQYLHLSVKKEDDDTVYFIIERDKEKKYDIMVGLSLGHNSNGVAIAAPILLIRDKYYSSYPKKVETIINTFYELHKGQKFLNGNFLKEITRKQKKPNDYNNVLEKIKGNWWVYAHDDEKVDGILRCCLTIKREQNSYNAIMESPSHNYDQGTVETAEANGRYLIIDLKATGENTLTTTRIIGKIGIIKENMKNELNRIFCIYITSGRVSPVSSNLVLIRESNLDFKTMQSMVRSFNILDPAIEQLINTDVYEKLSSKRIELL